MRRRESAGKLKRMERKTTGGRKEKQRGEGFREREENGSEKRHTEAFRVSLASLLSGFLSSPADGVSPFLHCRRKDRKCRSSGINRERTEERRRTLFEFRRPPRSPQMLAMVSHISFFSVCLSLSGSRLACGDFSPDCRRWGGGFQHPFKRRRERISLEEAETDAVFSPLHRETVKNMERKSHSLLQLNNAGLSPQTGRRNTRLETLRVKRKCGVQTLHSNPTIEHRSSPSPAYIYIYIYMHLFTVFKRRGWQVSLSFFRVLLESVTSQVASLLDEEPPSSDEETPSL
ncbi:hypothetical protein TGRUB_289810 [Toxoplasma gondii RUB]|uniref:Uncharacterized protein n=1 Tax=Toxoplasma gondii RUB TaxID=935652 RepID=A0A086M1F0_TOXGO|nr:hypothetical protein TGRUB_289810 [Toxoplasma gondii RUB]